MMMDRLVTIRAALIALMIVATIPHPAIATEAFCVMLMPDAGVDMLLNRCTGCREVTLERTRPGESIPNVRAMMLPGDAVTPAPFRGPGRTRILGERACPNPPGQGISKISEVR